MLSNFGRLKEMGKYNLYIADVHIEASRIFRRKIDKITAFCDRYPITLDENMNVKEEYKNRIIKSLFGDRIKDVNLFTYKFKVTNVKFSYGIPD